MRKAGVGNWWIGICLAMLASAAIMPPQGAAQAKYVDPLIGTKPNPLTKIGYAWDTGNVFPGAVVPRGMLAWSPDTTHARQIAGGYWYPDTKIEDFSLTHFSGRGVPSERDIGFMPVAEPVTVSPGRDTTTFAATFSHANESASPGYYRVKFDDGIETELAATPRTGMARFRFPAGATATLLIRANGEVSGTGDEVWGYADSHVGKGGPYRIYFYAQFGRSFSSVRTWNGDNIDDANTAKGENTGAILSFNKPNDGLIEVRVGISYTSLENAKDNLNRENKTAQFATVRRNAEALWNAELGRIEIQGGTDAAKRTFYTALYHCFIHPNLLDDANGQYLGMDDKVHTVAPGHHQYQNIPAWDQHRSHTALVAILAPKQTSDVMQSLVNYAEQDQSARPDGGGLPRWERVNRNSGGMVGDGDDSMIATSYAFGATQFDTKGALAAMLRGASRLGTTSDGRKVRDGLADYMSLGYVPGQASVTLEYANDDFALAQFARQLGDHDVYADYLKRSQNWENLFDPATGYLRPRLAASGWLDPFSPATGKGFIEGTAAQYLWLVNFDLPGLIARLGGNEAAIARLDHFFTQLNGGLNTEFAYMGNETCEEAPWVYDFASAPAKTEEVVRRIQRELYTDLPDGLPGNDDAGAMSSWYVFSALGLYPEIPGVAGFAIGSPMFPKAIVHLGNGSTIQIDGRDAAPEDPYVETLQVNGTKYNAPWLPWSSVSNGGRVVFTLGPKASDWGTQISKAPPSFFASVPDAGKQQSSR